MVPLNVMENHYPGHSYSRLHEGQSFRQSSHNGERLLRAKRVYRLHSCGAVGGEDTRRETDKHGDSFRQRGEPPRSADRMVIRSPSGFITRVEGSTGARTTLTP